MKEIVNELVIFESEFRDNQAVIDEIQSSVSLIKDVFQTSIENLMSKNKTIKKLLSMNHLESITRENKWDNISYLVQKKLFVSKWKFYPFRGSKEK